MDNFIKRVIEVWVFLHQMKTALQTLFCTKVKGHFINCGKVRGSGANPIKLFSLPAKLAIKIW